VDPTDATRLLAWEEVLPVAFVPGATAADARLAAHRVAANLRVLHTCEALEERRAERDEEHTGTAEIARLEQKIDLLIEMVGHMVSQSGSRPTAVVASLTAAGLSWRPADVHAAAVHPVAVGAAGTVEVYLRDSVAEALRMPGTVVAVTDDGRISFEFRGLAEAEVDALERFVFRQHRRSVADRRRTR